MRVLFRESLRVPRRATIVSALSLLALAAQPASGRAQRPLWLRVPHPKPSIYGRVNDSLTGLPAVGVGLGIDGRGRMTASDAAGWYLISGAPIGLHRVHFYCRAGLAFIGREITTRALTFQSATDSEVNFSISPRACKDPPKRSWSAVFRGHYTSGFESSHFVPCEDFESLTNTAFEGVLQRAWVEGSPLATREALKKWPNRGNPSYRSVFVRWQASITGPGSYGHLGGATHQMRVDRVLEVRLPRADDCK